MRTETNNIIPKGKHMVFINYDNDDTLVSNIFVAKEDLNLQHLMEKFITSTPFVSKKDIEFDEELEALLLCQGDDSGYMGAPLQWIKWLGKQPEIEVIAPMGIIIHTPHDRKIELYSGHLSVKGEQKKTTPTLDI